MQPLNLDSYEWQAFIDTDIAADLCRIYVFRRRSELQREFLTSDGVTVVEKSAAEAPKPLLTLPWRAAREVVGGILAAAREMQMTPNTERELAAKLHATEGARDTANDFARSLLAVIERKLMA